MRGLPILHSILPTPRSLTVAARMFCLLITNHSSLVTALLFLLLPIPYSLLPTRALAQGITPNSIITTVAGGSWVFRGDGKPAVDAPLGGLHGVAVDSAGNLFAPDFDNHIVVKISPTGVLTVVAGNGISGYSGDGGPAASASLRYPNGVAVDSIGNLYISDFGTHRIRKVSPTGFISTVAGNGVRGFSGDGGQATNASLREPGGVAADGAGNLYIADGGNARIRKVDPVGIITTVAGNGVRGFSGDGGPATSASLNIYVFGSSVAIDATGNLYIADTFNNRIRKVGLDGIITTVAGKATAGTGGDGGPATSAQLSQPFGISVDATGNLYIADTFNNRIRKVGLDGIITTVAGNELFKLSGDGGPATSASLHYPHDVAIDTAGSLYIADTSNNRIRKISSEGIVSTIAGVPATSTSLRSPNGVAIDLSGNVYIANTDSSAILKLSPAGTISAVAGDRGQGFAGDGGLATSALVDRPHGLRVDTIGNLYIADTGNNRIRKVSTEGIINTVAGSGPTGFGTAGGFSGDGGPATSAQLNRPQGVAVDSGGNLYIADTQNNRIRKVNNSWIINTIAGNGVGGFSGDGGPATSANFYVESPAAIDGAGNLYIPGGGRVRKVSPDGITTTVAGGGQAFPGDGGLAINSQISNGGVILDGAGNLYIADGTYDRIRKVWATVPTFAASPTSLSFTAPAGAPVVAAQHISVLSEALGLQWSAVTATESGGNWLSVTPATGRAPGVIAVGVNVSALNPGTYRGTVTVNSPLANPSARTVAVTLTVEAALVPKLVAEPLSLTFETPAGVASLPAKTLRISNGGSGTISWTAQSVTTSGGQWLEISPSSGSVTPGTPITAQVRALPGSLVAGVYTGSIRLSSQACTARQARMPVRQSR